MLICSGDQVRFEPSWQSPDTTMSVLTRAQENENTGQLDRRFETILQEMEPVVEPSLCGTASLLNECRMLGGWLVPLKAAGTIVPRMAKNGGLPLTQ
jgi:hypothetical protein